MYWKDDDGVLNIEYGFGSIMGFSTEQRQDGGVEYGLAATDPNPIGSPCKDHETLVGKPDCDAGIFVRFRFHKVDSLDILISDLKRIREMMLS